MDQRSKYEKCNSLSIRRKQGECLFKLSVGKGLLAMTLNPQKGLVKLTTQKTIFAKQKTSLSQKINNKKENTTLNILLTQRANIPYI